MADIVMASKPTHRELGYTMPGELERFSLKGL